MILVPTLRVWSCLYPRLLLSLFLLLLISFFLETMSSCAPLLLFLFLQFIGSEPKSTKVGLLEVATVKSTIQGDLSAARKSLITGTIVETLTVDGALMGKRNRAMVAGKGVFWTKASRRRELGHHGADAPGAQLLLGLARRRVLRVPRCRLRGLLRFPKRQAV